MTGGLQIIVQIILKMSLRFKIHNKFWNCNLPYRFRLRLLNTGTLLVFNPIGKDNLIRISATMFGMENLNGGISGL